MQNNRVFFNIMLADGMLWKYLSEIDKEAEEMFSRLVNKMVQEMVQAEGMSEKLNVRKLKKV